MTRLELLKYFHAKVLEENLPEEELDMNSGLDENGFLPEPHVVSGPFPLGSWEFNKVTHRAIRDDYVVLENLTMLETTSDNVPESVVWGIGDWWQYNLHIPKEATKPEDCKGIGSSGE